MGDDPEDKKPEDWDQPETIPDLRESGDLNRSIILTIRENGSPP